MEEEDWILEDSSLDEIHDSQESPSIDDRQWMPKFLELSDCKKQLEEIKNSKKVEHKFEVLLRDALTGKQPEIVACILHEALCYYTHFSLDDQRESTIFL